MLISVLSPKGGTGCTVSASVFAHCLSDYDNTLLIDANVGDLHVLAGVDDQPPYSFNDWCRSPSPTASSLRDISLNVTQHLRLVPGMSTSVEQEHTVMSYEKRNALIDEIRCLTGHVVVDLGQRIDRFARGIAEASDLIVLCVRQCYLGLHKATHHPLASHIDALVVLEESGRSITIDQIATTLSSPIVIEMQARRDFARAIDAGVVLHRMPVQLRTPISAFLKDVVEHNAPQETHDVFEDVHRRNQSSFWNDEQRKIS